VNNMTRINEIKKGLWGSSRSVQDGEEESPCRVQDPNPGRCEPHPSVTLR